MSKLWARIRLTVPECDVSQTCWKKYHIWTCMCCSDIFSTSVILLPIARIMISLAFLEVVCGKDHLKEALPITAQAFGLQHLNSPTEHSKSPIILKALFVSRFGIFCILEPRSCSKSAPCTVCWKCWYIRRTSSQKHIAVQLQCAYCRHHAACTYILQLSHYIA